MKLIDITRNLQDAPVYPGDPPATVTRIASTENGGVYNSSIITLCSHSGTHADAFYHFLPEGKSIDNMELTHYYGACRVISFPPGTTVTKKLLSGKIEGAERLAIHGGGNSFLDESAALYIAQCGVITVVTDALSVAPPASEAALHRLLFENGVALIENVVLDNVPDGEYTLSAFPQKITGCDGAPVRAVLISG